MISVRNPLRPQMWPARLTICSSTQLENVTLPPKTEFGQRSRWTQIFRIFPIVFYFFWNHVKSFFFDIFPNFGQLLSFRVLGTSSPGFPFFPTMTIYRMMMMFKIGQRILLGSTFTTYHAMHIMMMLMML